MNNAAKAQPTVLSASHESSDELLNAVINNQEQHT